MTTRPSYRLVILRQAKKELDKLDSQMRIRVMRRVNALAAEPRPAGVIRLAGTDELWRVRVGAYRILYGIRDDELVVKVVRVAHRSAVYRDY